jgi:hypothetical protein
MRDVYSVAMVNKCRRHNLGLDISSNRQSVRWCLRKLNWQATQQLISCQSNTEVLWDSDWWLILLAWPRQGAVLIVYGVFCALGALGLGGSPNWIDLYIVIRCAWAFNYCVGLASFKCSLTFVSNAQCFENQSVLVYRVYALDLEVGIANHLALRITFSCFYDIGLEHYVCFKPFMIMKQFDRPFTAML